ncbi:MAG: hypothetical protein EBT35_11120 [Alphaproteobacteria bacterium]|nr:hypothetical protein [Alphaproteobacteria bacterium]
MAKPAKKDAPPKAGAEAKPAAPAGGSHDPHHDVHAKSAQPTTASGILLHRFKSIDVSALKPADCRALIDEIRSVLAKGKEGMPVDLGDRVKLIRIWNALAWYVEEPDPVPVSEVPEVSEVPHVAEVPQEHHLEESAAEPDVPHEAVEEPEAETIAHITHEPEASGGEAALSAELVGEYEPSVLVEEDLVSPPPGARETDIVIDEPFVPQKTEAAAEPAIIRKRLRMVQDGVLTGRVLEAGTVVLVYPLDAQHLIDEGIAEMIEDATLSEESESTY